ncbi:lipopolysaccharide biosynthesis protein [Algibacter sp. L3A6]|uniref:lipopolysaccharide biosynthesis protein n=1 Tax=Algibacter sp. L3A6 TaxID=2686366 RepID=UPI00131CC3A6|nr:oligosaccharide flippase family protein [Algibacter sp. L3A6]
MRGVSLGAKFVFALYISKYLEVDVYGEYNLLVTSVTFLLFAIGLDFYSFSAREILAISGEKRFFFIKHQFLFHFIVYILFIPIIYFFCKEFLRTDLFLWFYILVVSEHFSQEFYRIFIFHNKQLISNILLFFRTFFWIALISLDVFVLEEHEFSIDLILKFWILGSLISCVLAVFILRKEYSFSIIEIFSIREYDFKVLKTGLFICMPIFLSTISYKLIEYSDRFLIDIFLNKTQVGVYSLYSNFSNITNIVVNTVVTLMLFPKLVENVKKENYDQFFLIKAKFKKELIYVTFGMSLLLAFLIFPLLDWVGKDDYSEYVISFFILILGNIFLNLSFLPHYLLYAFSQDVKNIIPTIIAMVINVLLNVVLLLIFKNIIVVAIATTVSYIIIFILKQLNWLRFKRHLYLK